MSGTPVTNEIRRLSFARVERSQQAQVMSWTVLAALRLPNSHSGEG